MWANDRRVLAAQGSPRSTVIPAVGGSVYSMCLSDKYLIAGAYEHLIQVRHCNCINSNAYVIW